MAGEAGLVSRVRAALAHIPDVEDKRMFGSTAFMVRGKLCVGVRPERVMFRIDPAFHDAAVERKGCRTVFMGGREYRGYVYVDAECVRTKDALEYWIDRALSYNEVVAATKEGDP